MIPNDCRREAGVFKQVKIFGAPLFDCPAKTAGLDPPLCSVHVPGFRSRLSVTLAKAS